MKNLVTGAHGKVGRALVPALMRKGHDVRATDLTRTVWDRVLDYKSDMLLVNNRTTIEMKRPYDQGSAVDLSPSLLPEMERQDTNKPLVTSLGLEKEINTFFRLSSPSVIRRLREAFPDLPEHPDHKTVFLKLRELRNKW